MRLIERTIVLVLSCSLASVAAPQLFAARLQVDVSTAQPDGNAPKQTPEQLQQLVAPIALYPDALVSQILAGATYPTEIVEADRRIQKHSNLNRQDLANEVDKQQWDPSVKALTQFPSVLGNMDKNLSWTSALGEAYMSQPQDVMDAVQTMRSRAQKAGNLKSNNQVKVENHGQAIIIQPADSDVVYVPTYDPWLVFGPPIVAWPGWYAYPGLYIAGPGISFGLGFHVGFFDGFGWGWHNWGFDWAHRAVIYDREPYISHTRTFFGRNGFDYGRPDFDRGFHGATPHGDPGLHSGAFGGFDHGGIARGYSFRGRSSFGGGFHGGGGRR